MPPHRHEYPPEKIDRIVSLRQAGCSLRKIGTELDMPGSTVSSILKRVNGSTTVMSPASGSATNANPGAPAAAAATSSSALSSPAEPPARATPIAPAERPIRPNPNENDDPRLQPNLSGVTKRTGAPKPYPLTLDESTQLIMNRYAAIQAARSRPRPPAPAPAPAPPPPPPPEARNQSFVYYPPHHSIMGPCTPPPQPASVYNNNPRAIVFRGDPLPVYQPPPTLPPLTMPLPLPPSASSSSAPRPAPPPPPPQPSTEPMSPNSRVAAILALWPRPSPPPPKAPKPPKIKMAGVTEKNRLKRWEWARAHASWTREDWHKVCFSAESTFRIGSARGQARMWVRDLGPGLGFVPLGDPPSPESDVEYDRTTQAVPAWGLVTADVGIGPLAILEPGQTMGQDRYITTLDTHLIPLLESDPRYAGFSFVHANTPHHTSKSVRAFLASKNVNVVPWPPQSSDLNPMENLWAKIKDKVAGRTDILNTREKMAKYVEEEWAKIEQTEILNWINSMPDRVQNVLRNQGGSSRSG